MTYYTYFYKQMKLCFNNLTIKAQFTESAMLYNIESAPPKFGFTPHVVSTIRKLKFQVFINFIHLIKIFYFHLIIWHFTNEKLKHAIHKSENSHVNK